MRKIEADMLTAVQTCEYWQSGNTNVVPFFDPETGAESTRVYLHGNHIADVTKGKPVKVYIKTLRRWPTRLTVSRLRALGVDVRIKGRVPYLDGVRV